MENNMRLISVKRFFCILLVFSLCWLQLPATVVAEDITLPEEFYGEITINGQPAPEGTEIVAKIGGVERGRLTASEEGAYGDSATFSERLIVSGEESDIGENIAFFVDGDLADQTAVFTPGESVELDLSVTAYPLVSSDIQIDNALNFLRENQASDGEIGSYVASSWIALAIAAAGEDPHDWSTGEDSLVDYLAENASANLDADTATDWERSILAIVAAGESPYSFGNIDYVSTLLNFYDGAQLGDADLLNDDIWALPALLSIGAGADIVPDIVDYIEDNQNADGGWSWSIGGDSEVDTTASAISALICAGVDPDETVITSALDYLKDQQQNNGGFAYEGTTNSAADAWVIQSLNAAGQNPADEDWRIGENNPVKHLLGLQDDDGAFQWTASTRSYPEWMTAYAILALLGADWPQDSEAPEISNCQPASGSKTTSTSPDISAAYSDAVSGIDTDSLQLFLDEVDVTAEAILTDSAIEYSPDKLDTGTHSVKLTVSDKKGNLSTQTWTFKIAKSSGGGGGGGGSSSSVATTLKTTATPTPSATPTPVIIPGIHDITGIIDSRSILTQNLELASIDEKCRLSLDSGVAALTGDGLPLTQLAILNLDNPPSAPDQTSFIGPVYDCGPAGATFTPAVTLTFACDPALIPLGISENNLVIASWNEASGTWTELESMVDINAHTVRAQVSHFCSFAVVAHTRPAEFSLSGLTVSPSAPDINDTVKISALLTNSGDISGTLDLVLEMDASQVQTQSLTLEGNSSRTVDFTITALSTGDHTVKLNTLEAGFRVEPLPSPTTVSEIPSTASAQSVATASETAVPDSSPKGWIIGLLIVLVAIALVVFLVIKKKSR